MLSPTAQAWVLEHGWTAVIAFGFFLAIGSVMYFTRPDPFEVSGYETARVQGSFDTSDKHGYSVRFALVLPDASIVQLSVASAATAANVTDTACLERRVHDSGRVSHRVVTPDLCTDAGS